MNNVPQVGTSTFGNFQELDQSSTSTNFAAAALNVLTQELCPVQGVSKNIPTSDPVDFPFDDTTWDNMSADELRLTFYSLLSYINNLAKKWGEHESWDLGQLMNIAYSKLKNLAEKMKKFPDKTSKELELFKAMQDKIGTNPELIVPNLLAYLQNNWSNVFKNYLSPYLSNLSIIDLIDFSSAQGASDVFALLNLITDLGYARIYGTALYEKLINLFAAFLPYDGKPEHNFFIQALTSYFYKKENGNWDKVNQDVKDFVKNLPADPMDGGNPAQPINPEFTKLLDSLREFVKTDISSALKDIVKNCSTDILKEFYQLFFVHSEGSSNQSVSYNTSNIVSISALEDLLSEEDRPALNNFVKQNNNDSFNEYLQQMIQQEIIAESAVKYV